MVIAIITLITTALGILGFWLKWYLGGSSTGNEDAKILQKQRDIITNSIDGARKLQQRIRDKYK